MALAPREPLCGVICLAGLQAPATDTLSAVDATNVQDLTISACLSILDMVRSLATDPSRGATPLVIVTRMGERVSDAEMVSPIQSAIRGLGRTIALEHPSLRCKLIDLGAARGAGEVEQLIMELENDDGEEQVALRGQHRFIARLCHPPMEAPAAPAELVRAESRSFRLDTRAAGILDNLYFGEVPRARPSTAQVEIEVEAAGLNFLDVLGAMAARPDLRPAEAPRFGYECAGRVVRVGSSVTAFRVGDLVAAVSPNSMASHVIVPEVLCCHVPDRLTIEQAASVSVAYVTAWYGLEHMARLQKGESVLIHSAADASALPPCK